jgi:hypothetical protein
MQCHKGLYACSSFKLLVKFFLPRSEHHDPILELPPSEQQLVLQCCGDSSLPQHRFTHCLANFQTHVSVLIQRKVRLGEEHSRLLCSECSLGLILVTLVKIAASRLTEIKTGKELPDFRTLDEQLKFFKEEGKRWLATMEEWAEHNQREGAQLRSHEEQLSKLGENEELWLTDFQMKILLHRARMQSQSQDLAHKSAINQGYMRAVKVGENVKVKNFFFFFFSFLLRGIQNRLSLSSSLLRMRRMMHRLQSEFLTGIFSKPKNEV